MKRIWPIIYFILAPIIIFSGYDGTRRNPDSNLDWIALTIIPVVVTLLPIGLFLYGLSYSGRSKMPRPSLDRHPFGWWTDTLQPLRCSSIGTALSAVGASAAYPATSDQARMGIYLLVILAVSTAIGEVLVYKLFKERIGEQPMDSNSH